MFKTNLCVVLGFICKGTTSCFQTGSRLVVILGGHRAAAVRDQPAAPVSSVGPPGGCSELLVTSRGALDHSLDTATFELVVENNFHEYVNQNKGLKSLKITNIIRRK